MNHGRRPPTLEDVAAVDAYLQRSPEQVNVSELVEQGKRMVGDDKYYVSHNQMVAILDAGGRPVRPTSRIIRFEGVLFVHACGGEDLCYDKETRRLFEKDE